MKRETIEWCQFYWYDTEKTCLPSSSSLVPRPMHRQEQKTDTYIQDLLYFFLSDPSKALGIRP